MRLLAAALRLTLFYAENELLNLETQSAVLWGLAETAGNIVGPSFSSETLGKQHTLFTCLADFLTLEKGMQVPQIQTEGMGMPNVQLQALRVVNAHRTHIAASGADTKKPKKLKRRAASSRDVSGFFRFLTCPPDGNVDGLQKVPRQFASIFSRLGMFGK